MKPTKQTAGNNQALAAIKKQYNHKIYAKALEIMNAQGHDQTVAYVQQFTTRNVAEWLANPTAQ